MADEVKPDNEVNVKSTVEVLDAKGGAINRSASPLADIFSKIEAGKAEGLTADEALKPEAKPALKTEEKKVEQKVAPTDIEKKIGESEVKPEPKADEEPSRKSLDIFDKKKPEVKQVQEAKPEDEVPEEELQVLPADKPKTAKRIEALLKKVASVNSEVAKTKAEVTEKAAKLAELEKKLGEVKTVDPKVQEEIDAQRNELAMYRRRYGLETDPEVRSKFDDRITSAEAEIPDILKKNGAGEPLLNIIKEEGGWQKFTRSGRSITLSDGTTTTAAQLADTIVNQLPYGDKSRINALTVEQIQLQRDRDQFFKKEQATAADYFKKQEEATKAQRDAYDKQIQENAKLIQAWHKDVTEKNAWLQEKEIPANAKPEEKAAIEEDNKYTRQLNAVLKKSVAPKDVNESLEIVFDSVRYWNERRQNAKLTAELERVNAELASKSAEIAKFKGSSRSTPKSGSIVGGGSEAVNTTKEGPRNLADAFAAIERGEILSSR